MFTLAELWGLRPDATNPCRHVERYREQRIERFLSDGELVSLGTALAQAEAAGAESERATSPSLISESESAG